MKKNEKPFSENIFGIKEDDPLYKAIIAVFVLSFVLSACMAPSAQKPDETTVPVTSEPAATTPAVSEEHRVLVVFSSENTDDFSTLTLENAKGEAIVPVSSETTGEPVYGVFYLTAGEYSFTMADSGKMTFVIDGAYDEVLVPVESPADVFPVNTFSSTAVNPVYKGVVSEKDIAPIEMNIEDRAESLRDFYRSVMQNEKGS